MEKTHVESPFFFFRSYSGLTCSSSLLQPCLVLEIYQVSNSYDRSIQISVRTSFPLLELGHSVHACRKNSALAAMSKHLNKAFISLYCCLFGKSVSLVLILLATCIFPLDV